MSRRTEEGPRMWKALALLAGLLLVLTVAAPAAATRGQPDLRLPFTMRIVGTDQLEWAPGTPPFLDLTTFGSRCSVLSSWVTTVSSTGTAGHLGSVAVTQSHCTQFDFFAGPPQTATITDGTMVVTATGGDELRIRYSGSFLFYPSDVEGIGTSVLTYGPVTITGGTGRFAGATGSLDGSAVDDFPMGFNVATFSGWISYDASGAASH